MMRHQVIEIALQAGMKMDGEMFYTNDDQGDQDVHISQLEAFATRVAAAEREACAKVCEQMRVGIDAFGSIDYHVELTRDMCADAIRARGAA